MEGANDRGHAAEDPRPRPVGPDAEDPMARLNRELDPPESEDLEAYELESSRAASRGRSRYVDPEDSCRFEKGYLDYRFKKFSQEIRATIMRQHAENRRAMEKIAEDNLGTMKGWRDNINNSFIDRISNTVEQKAAEIMERAFPKLPPDTPRPANVEDVRKAIKKAVENLEEQIVYHSTTIERAQEKMSSQLSAVAGEVQQANSQLNIHTDILKRVDSWMIKTFEEHKKDLKSELGAVRSAVGATHLLATSAEALLKQVAATCATKADVEGAIDKTIADISQALEDRNKTLAELMSNNLDAVQKDIDRESKNIQTAISRSTKEECSRIETSILSNVSKVAEEVKQVKNSVRQAQADIEKHTTQESVQSRASITALSTKVSKVTEEVITQVGGSVREAQADVKRHTTQESVQVKAAITSSSSEVSKMVGEMVQAVGSVRQAQEDAKKHLTQESAQMQASITSLSSEVSKVAEEVKEVGAKVQRAQEDVTANVKAHTTQESLQIRASIAALSSQVSEAAELLGNKVRAAELEVKAAIAGIIIVPPPEPWPPLPPPGPDADDKAVLQRIEYGLSRLHSTLESQGRVVESKLGGLETRLKDLLASNASINYKRHTQEECSRIETSILSNVSEVAGKVKQVGDSVRQAQTDIEKHSTQESSQIRASITTLSTEVSKVAVEVTQVGGSVREAQADVKRHTATECSRIETALSNKVSKIAEEVGAVGSSVQQAEQRVKSSIASLRGLIPPPSDHLDPGPDQIDTNTLENILQTLQSGMESLIDGLQSSISQQIGELLPGVEELLSAGNSTLLEQLPQAVVELLRGENYVKTPALETMNGILQSILDKPLPAPPDNSAVLSRIEAELKIGSFREDRTTLDKMQSTLQTILGKQLPIFPDHSAVLGRIEAELKGSFGKSNKKLDKIDGGVSGNGNVLKEIMEKLEVAGEHLVTTEEPPTHEEKAQYTYVFMQGPAPVSMPASGAGEAAAGPGQPQNGRKVKKGELGSVGDVLAGGEEKREELILCTGQVPTAPLPPPKTVWTWTYRNVCCCCCCN